MNRLVRPVMFAFEPDVVHQYSKISFGASGAPTIDTNQSKGICSVVRKSYSITGDITNTSATVANVSSFAGLYKGMSISGTGIPAATTISSMNPGAGTITLSAAATATTASLAITVAGGQYTITFGSQFSPAKFDAYVKLLGLSHNWDMSGLQGGASTGASAPAAPSMILVGNNISSSSLANLIVQFGQWSGATFTAADPASGEIVRIAAQLCRSTAK